MDDGKVRREKFVGVRFDRATHELVKQVTIAQGIDISDFIRNSVRRELARLSFLPEEDKKALEVTND